MSKRGRPSVEPTDDEKQKVKELLSAKAPLADIASMVGHSIPWLRKYFARELKSGKKIEVAAKPEFKPRKGDHQKVERYIGCRMSPDQVARVIGCSVEDLQAHFAEQIATGEARTRANIIDALHDQMEEGISASTNRLEAMTAIPAEGAAPTAGGVGKKAAAAADAKAAVQGGGRFAPRPAPKVVVDNT